MISYILDESTFMASASSDESWNTPPDDVTILAFITWSSPFTICSMFLSWPRSDWATSSHDVGGPGDAVGGEGEATSAGGESVVSGAGGGVAARGTGALGECSSGVDRPLAERRRSLAGYGANRDDDETMWCR